MSLLLKLVGLENNEECIIKDKYIGIVNKDKIVSILLSLNLLINEINELIFIRNGSQFVNEFIINDNMEEYIFIFTPNNTIKNKLKNIFQNKIPNNDIITQNIINEINEETIKLFNDNDFKNLIDIYKRKPELFQTLLQYTYCGNIKYNIINNSNNYLFELNKLKELNLNIEDDKIIEKLEKYGGHLKLTLRALLCEL